MSQFNASTIEQAALDLPGNLGYTICYAETIAPGEPGAARDAQLPKLLSGEVRVEPGQTLTSITHSEDRSRQIQFSPLDNTK
ncbi:MAG: hypothetical protein ACYDBJ_19745 [Aggregatilineales bacterium]